MRISLFELLSLMIPVAFMCLWIADFLQKDRINWQDFSLPSMTESQKNEKPSFILCVPEMFWNMSSPMNGEIDPELLNDVDMTQLVAYRYEYRYWTQSRDEWPPETSWIVEHGANKEPSLILVARDGTTKNICGFRFGRDEIIDFLELARIRFDREKILIGLFATSLAAILAIMVWRRK